MTCRRTWNQAVLVAFLPEKDVGKGEGRFFSQTDCLRKRQVGEGGVSEEELVRKRTKAVSSCGLEMSAGLASDFEGFGEELRDATGVREP
jgi:hypothetical protein